MISKKNGAVNWTKVKKKNKPGTDAVVVGKKSKTIIILYQD